MRVQKKQKKKSRWRKRKSLDSTFPKGGTLIKTKQFTGHLLIGKYMSSILLSNCLVFFIYISIFIFILVQAHFSILFFLFLSFFFCVCVCVCVCVCFICYTWLRQGRLLRFCRVKWEKENKKTKHWIIAKIRSVSIFQV